MRRSKLEIYIAVLETLATNGPMRLTKITYKSNLNYVLLKQIVSNLQEKQLIEERKINNFLVYAATPKAKIVLLQLKEVNQSLPFLEEAIWSV
jgi:predicted transcriptional regulator